MDHVFAMKREISKSKENGKSTHVDGFIYIYYLFYFYFLVFCLFWFKQKNIKMFIFQHCLRFA